eukprot:TRINITY_DN39322_c0_g1_i1.p1 TRINITY_DN39322_c0_g1~~TRINITY_DN39322_c0_g1_i1.p1  ORF type:complete len:150 (-),score=14.20 TRINITY_DN39322_c0_g1_i1:257-679(-)
MVFLSLLIAVAGAYVSLTTTSYMRLVRNSRWYYVQVVQAGVGLGLCCIWGMHFVGMRAVTLYGGERSNAQQEVEVKFELVLTCSSGVASSFMSSLAVHLVLGRKIVEERMTRDREAFVRVSSSSLCVGIGCRHNALHGYA